MINIEDYAGEPGIELGIISAYLKKNSTSENKKRMTSLLKDLTELGLTKTTISKGWYEGSFEMSVIIISNGNLRDKLLKLAEKYEQESFIVKPKGREDATLIFTGGGEIPLGTFEKMTPEQAHKSVSKSQPANVTDWYWRYSTPEEKFEKESEGK